MLSTLRRLRGGYLCGIPKGRFYSLTKTQVSLGALIQKGVLPVGSDNSFVRLNPLFDQKQFFPGLVKGDSTSQAVIKAMVDATADSGANAIMLDTSILSKVSNICLVDTAGSEMVDINRFRTADGMVQKGILTLQDIRFFVDYCHFRGVQANVAGSVESYQAQQLWVLIPDLDQVSARGAASAVDVDPSNPQVSGPNTRQYRIIKRSLVRGMAAPEHRGCAESSRRLSKKTEAMKTCDELHRMIMEKRLALGLPELETYFVSSDGQIVAKH